MLSDKIKLNMNFLISIQLIAVLFNIIPSDAVSVQQNGLYTSNILYYLAIYC